MKKLMIITGASSGIGEELAKQFSATGRYTLGLIARNLKKMQSYALPDTICLQADVADYQQLKAAISIAQNKFGEVDCLINNAGYAKAGEFTDIDLADDDSMIQANICGVINGCKIVLPEMRKRQTGTIINISSIADRNSRPQIATYAATKAAIKSLTESLRAANASFNIRICNVAPAKIQTPMLMTAGLAEDVVIKVSDFAKTVLWIYEQPQSICIRDIIVAPTQYKA